MANTNILNAITAIEGNRDSIRSTLSGWYNTAGNALASNTDKLAALATTLGTISSFQGANAANRATTNGGTITISQGYHDGNGKIEISAGSCEVSGGALSGGDLSVTANYTNTPTLTLSSGSSTNMSNVTSGAQDTTNYPYYFKINGSTNKLTGSTTVTRDTITRADIQDAHTAGYITDKSATTVIESTSIEGDSVSPTVTVNQATNSTYVSLKEAAGEVTGSNLSGTNTITVYSTDGSNAGVNVSSALGTKATSEPTSGYYLAFTAKSSATALTQTAKITTAGYTPTNDSFATRSVSYSASNVTNYFPVTAVTFDSAVASGKTADSYTDISSTDSAPILVTGDYLYVNAGYTPNVKISLAKLVPDSYSSLSFAPANYIHKGYFAWDADGKAITGTMEDVTPSFTGGEVSIKSLDTTPTNATATITEDGTFFSSSTYGVTTTKPSGTDGTNYLTVDGTLSTTPGSVSVSVEANRSAVTYSADKTGYINITSGTNASAAPSSNVTDSDTVSVAVTPTDNFEPYYIPVTSLSAGDGSCSYVECANMTTSTSSNGIYIQFKGSGSVSCGAGVIASGSTSSDEATATRYITAITVPKDNTFSLTTTADTALDTTSNVTITNNAYRKLVITNSTNATASITNSGTVDVSGSGRTNFTVGSTTTGTLYATGYIDNGTTTSSGAQVVISNGKWNYNSVTPSASAQGPFYGETRVGEVTSAIAISVLGGAKSVPTPIDALTSATSDGGDAQLAVSAGYYNAGTIKIDGALLTRLQAI